MLLLSLLIPGTGLVAADETPQRGAAASDDDPLLRALRQLQQEVDELRGEIRRSSPQAGMPSKALTEPRTSSRNPQTSDPGMQQQSARNVDRAATSSAANKKPQTSAAPTSAASLAITPSTSDHWSFQTLNNPALPTVRNDKWCRSDLDRFVLARLENAGLGPNEDANRHTLLRRVSFDLTGLPPTVQDIEEFTRDPSSTDEALARVVDRLLNSPQFGERWGRHWLDIVRYADSVGRNWNAPFTYAWRYRNYVIDSLNDDKPYDRFLMEQLAGDLLTAVDLPSRRDQLVATGFLALGAMDIIEPDGESLMMDRIDEQIDVTTRAFLGLTVACARCHDHKYEPVSMRDYYALAGIFYSTETKSGQRRGNYVADDDLILLPSADGRQTTVAGVHSMDDMNREHRTGGWREVLWTTDPNLAMAAVEGRLQDCPVRLDGEAWKRGPIPPRGDFQIAGLSGIQNIPADRSGRLQLARWIVSPHNPLTPRVMVNRIWQHLLGRGLVETVDNFGKSGTGPTHPRLLDYLAAEFRKDWSVKSGIRSIVLSRTYRQSSHANSAGIEADAGNSLYWRMNARRLELEAVRDSMLTIAGRLTFDRPEGIQLAGRGGKGRWGETRSLLSISAPYRTVYLPVLRSLLPEMYSTFDFPNPTQVKGKREVTTVAPQALFLMNSDFTSVMATSAAHRIAEEGIVNAEQRISRIYLRVVGRPPEPEEVDAAGQFLSDLTGQTSEQYRWSAFIQALMISGEFRTLL